MQVYRNPKSVPVPNCSGYPNTTKNTQTKKIRGTPIATKGTMYNPKGD